jgi:hypothetical protein
MTSRKMVIAVCTPWTVVSRSSLMSVIITFMFEPAKLQMNCARASGTSTRRRALVGPRAVPGSGTLVPSRDQLDSAFREAARAAMLSRDA